MSSGSSITWKIRSPDAVARCAWPIHMPSIRSGITSISTSTLNWMNAPSESDPDTTMRPPTSSTAACAISGRNAIIGT